MSRKIHRLKTWPGPFKAVKCGLKPFEIRKNDRDYKDGDILVLDEWNPNTGKYTTAEAPIVRLVTHLLTGFGLQDGYVALGLDRVVKEAEGVILEVAPPRPSDAISDPKEESDG